MWHNVRCFSHIWRHYKDITTFHHLPDTWKGLILDVTSDEASHNKKRSRAMVGRQYDIVVWGSTGFTGRLTCAYLHNTYPELKWAIAGRNKNTLAELKRTLDLKESVGVIVTDLSDKAALRDMASSTKVVLSTAGPYAKIGTPVVEACLAGGAHYCDLTGEAPWVREIADKFADEAREKKLKIVNCCGFDCIPCDLGVQLVAEELQSQGCVNIKEIRFLADKMKGGASGGTMASVFNIFETLPFSELRKLLNPFYLNPRNALSEEIDTPHNNAALTSQSSDNLVMGYDHVTKSWTVPYLMQAIDTRLVNRSNALSDYRYGRTFVFSERMIVPHAIAALVVSVAMSVFQVLVAIPFTRALVKKIVPAPGQGPDQDTLENGFFTARLWGSAVHPATGKEVLVQGSVQAYHGDPGYKQTAKMISETAVCLAQDQASLPPVYGILTPSTALGKVLRERLHRRGIEFTIVK